MKISKLKILLTTLVFTTFIFSGCSSTNKQVTTSQKQENKVLTFGSSFKIDGLDPVKDWNGWYCVEYGMGETLIKMDDKSNPVPWIAKEWKKVDDTTWNITIKDNVKFNNGKEVKAAEVKESLERCMKNNKTAKGLLDIASIKAKDKELTIKNNKPNPILIKALSMAQTTIHDAKAADENNEKFLKDPIFTGPFKLKEYKKDSHTIVVKNDNYWGDKTNLNEVTFKYIPDDNTRLMALQSGEIQIADNLPAENIKTLSKDSKFEIQSIETLRSHMIILNSKSELFKETNVKKAINMCFDRNEIADKLMQGNAVPAVGPFPLSLPFDSDKLKGYKFDVNESKKLLDEAGWKVNSNGIREKDGKKLEFTCLSYKGRPELPVILEAMQQKLKDIGIIMNISNVENITQSLKSGKFDAAIYSLNTTTCSDSQYMLDILFKTDGDSNFGKYSNPTLDKLTEDLRVTFDPKKRAEITKECQQLILDDSDFIFVAYPKRTFVLNKEVKNYKLTPVEYYSLTEKVDRIK